MNPSYLTCRGGGKKEKKNLIDHKCDGLISGPCQVNWFKAR